MSYIFKNNSTSRLKIDIDAVSTSIPVLDGEGARFPQPTGSEYFAVTLEDRRTGQLEVCLCTAVANDILTVQRAQEGTQAQAFIRYATVSHRPTAGTFDYLLDLVINAGGYTKTEADDRFINTAGDTMTGPLMLYGFMPTDPVQATPKGYVDTYFAPLVHTHTIAQVTGLQAALDGKAVIGPNDGAIYGWTGTGWTNIQTNLQIGWNDITGKPTTFPPSTHTHPTSEVTNLDTTLATINASITSLQNTKVSEAPVDGTPYQRQDANWIASLADAPFDGTPYIRQDAAWINLPPLLSEAPMDGQLYSRRGSTSTWVVASAGAVVSDTPPTGTPVSTLWWESDTGALFINYQDPNTTQWVQVNAAGMPEAPKDGKPYARLDGGWFDVSGFVDVTEMNAALGSYLPLAGGALTGTVSSTAVISASINGGAGTYALFGANAGAGGGVYGQGAGSIYGILGYAGGYSLYGNGSIYVSGGITCGNYINAPSGMQVSANYILGYAGGNTWTIPSGALFEFAFSGTTRYRIEPTIVRNLNDNTCALGTGSYRYTTVFATTGTINTSDENEKTDIRPLNEAELRVARALKPLICMYRWKDRVEEKGPDARIHTGIIAQRVMEAFAAEGLNAADYGLFCVDPKVIYHPAVRGEDGVPIEEEWEEPDGVRYGVRYDEMAMFILAGL